MNAPRGGIVIEDGESPAARSLILLLANPGASVQRTPWGVEVVTGSGGHAAAEAGRGRSPGEFPSDCVTIRVFIEDGVPVRVEAARDVTTFDELYFRTLPGGGLVLGDHFAAVLATVPVAERSVPARAIADHLLFRTTPGTGTYVAGIERLGHGDRLDWRPGGGGPLVRRDRTLSRSRGIDGQGARIDAVDEALGSAMGAVGRDDRHHVNMLSGGVDSTLLHSYLAPGTPSVSTATDSPEFGFEVEYARRASRLLGTHHQVVEVREADYLGRLEDTIETLGLPPQHLQTVLLDAAFQAPYDAFVTGQLADALFGLESSLLGWRAWAFRHALRTPVAPLAARASAGMRARIDRMQAARRELALPVEQPGSHAMAYALYSDLEATRRTVGAEMIRDRLLDRLRYVRGRVDLPEADRGGLAGHLELGHWLDFYGDDTVSLWRQLAHGRGRSLHAPFTARAVAQCALDVPSPARYVRRGRMKHLLKSLLARRVPGYPVHQAKGGSGLPFHRYARSGPLRDALRDYSVPEFTDRAELDRLFDQPTWMTWNVITFAIWNERVLRRAEVRLPNALRRLDWPLSRATPGDVVAAAPLR
jgi:asparagine synthetase B (glutamine-hydrolysing)